MGEPAHIRVRATAGAKREAVLVRSPNVFYISIREKAEQGAANKRIRELVAQEAKVPLKQVRLVKGAQQPSKVYLIYRD